MGTNTEQNSLLSQIERQYQLWPQREALVCGAERFTYADLQRTVDTWVSNLLTQGVKPGEHVGVCLERSSAIVFALLSLWKCGACYVPLDPRLPGRRLALMAKESACSHILGQAQLLKCFDQTPCTLLPLDDLRSAPTDFQKPTFETAGSAIAYLMSTSGSTGIPNVVEVHQSAIERHVRVMADFYQLTENDRVLQFSSINFDPSLEQILPTLLRGGTCVLRDQDLWTPQRLSAVIDQEQLTVINLPPAYWAQVVENWKINPDSIPTHRPKLCIIGGDVLPVDALRTWYELGLESIQLLNAYGPTEATITSTIYALPGINPPEEILQRVPIGACLPGRTIVLLNAEGQLLPPGVEGELCIGGECLANGYFNNPEQTARKFWQLDMPDGSTVRVFRTGDRVLQDEQGVLHFLGRVDSQVSIRGIRLELGEVAAVLKNHQAVKEVRVLLREGQSLSVCVVPERGPTLTVRELQAFARRHLPEHGQPRDYFILDELPLLPSGKVDVEALRNLSPTVVVKSPSHDGARPLRDLEKLVLGVWSQILPDRSIGLHDNFFELGGDSLKLLTLHQELEVRLGREFDVLILFRHPTVAIFLKWWESGDKKPVLELLQDGQPEVLPAALMQRRRLMEDSL